MNLARRAIWCLVVAMAAIGLMAPSAQADIILFDNYLLHPPLGSEADELDFVVLKTGVDLHLFAKKDDDQATQFFTLETTLTITDAAGDGPTTWQVDWTTVDWDIRYILVQGGAPGHGDNRQIYTLWEVTPAQFKDSDGPVTVSLDDFPDKTISHITVFGVNTPTVPEPTTLLLLAAGLLGTAALGRRRR